MGKGSVERALFLTDLEGLSKAGGEYSRLYFGHECCPRRLPTRRELGRARSEADRRGMGFTLVTPFLNEGGLRRALSLLEEFASDRAGEVVVNDLGLLEEMARREWKGKAVLGRLLTRQRRGAGWRGELPDEKGVSHYLRSSSLESTRMVEWFRSHYGIRRFEIDDLLQGVQVGPLPEDVRLSVYTPYVLLTVTRLCPWSFDGRRWMGSEGCSALCRGDTLVLHSEEGGAPLFAGGGCQFLKKESGREIYSGPQVDRHVHQPSIPA